MLLAVDGNSLVHRSFHAQAHTGLHTEDGRPMWAVRGLLAQLVAAVERIGPDAVVVGFDDPDCSHRRDRWPQYKAARSDKLPTLVDQLQLAADVLRGMGVAVVVPDRLGGRRRPRLRGPVRAHGRGHHRGDDVGPRRVRPDRPAHPGAADHQRRGRGVAAAHR